MNQYLALLIKYRKQSVILLSVLVIASFGAYFYQTQYNQKAKQALVSSQTVENILEQQEAASESAKEEEKRKDEEAKKDFSKGLSPKTDKKLPQGFQLVINKIGINWQVLDGESPDSLLLKGFWHYPHTSTPDQGSNTVILGHRWVYKSGDPRTMYSLDKLKEGDLIDVYFNQKKFTYKTKKSYITKPSDLTMMQGSLTPILTLLTSHPIEENKILSKERLVVVSELVN